MSRSVHNEPALRWSGNGWREKIRHLCVHGANRYPVFLRTSQFRQFITLVFLFLLMVLCCIVGFSVLSESLIRTHVRDVILGNIHDHATQSRLTDTATLIAQFKRDNQAKTDELPLFLVMSKQGEILYHNAGWMLSGPNHTACKMDVPCLKALLVEKGALKASDQRHSAPESNLVGMSVALDDGGVLFTAYNLRPMLERIRTIPLVAGAGLFVVLLFSLVVSRHFSLRSLSSVERIRTALHRYSAGEQYVRMPLSTRDDDFHSLSHDINQNLERIERLMEQVRSTSSHIAHELRTPLTHLQNRLYNLTDRQGLEHEMREELHQAVEEVHKILGLFRTVMRIGEIESGRCVHQFAHFEVRSLLEEVSEYYQPLADAHHCQLLIDAPAGTPLFGDRALLFQALANLIENALKYAAQGKAITLSVTLYRGWTALRVSDRGPGIPENLHATALERFQRLEGAQQQPGFGLGLSLVKAIAELHGGQLCMASANPGLHVYLCLKRT